MASWIEKQKLNPSVICDQLTLLVSVSETAQVSFKDAFAFEELKIALFGMIEFEKHIPFARRRGILWSALVETARERGGKIDPKNLIRVINRQSRLYSNLPLKKYYLLTTVSINSLMGVSNVAWKKVRITFPTLIKPSDFKEIREKLRVSFDRSTRIPDTHKWVRVGLSARDSHDGIDQALWHLDLTRAIWNLRLNDRSELTHAERRPINKVLRGPVATLFDKSGASVDHWWFEPDFDSNGPSYNRRDIDLSSYHQKFAAKLRTHNLRLELERLLIHLVRALDQRDPEVCFNRLWSLLELLTGATNYEDAVVRTSAIYKVSDRDLVRQALHSVRSNRNRLIHRGDDLQDVRSQNYILKYHVEQVLLTLLSTRFSFETLAEFGEFLSIAKSNDLARQIQIRQYAQYYLR